MLTFEINELPPLTNQRHINNWRAHHAVTRKWKERAAMEALCLKGTMSPLPRAHLVLTRYSAVPPDSDGLVGSFKNVIDGLVVAKVLVDDKFVNIGMPTYLWEKAPRRGGRIKVSVWKPKHAD